MAYGTFRAILDEARALAEENRRLEAEPEACPKCGSRLDIRNGIRNCPMGHWRQGGGRNGAL